MHPGATGWLKPKNRMVNALDKTSPVMVLTLLQFCLRLAR
jgi:hypothetical protein